MVAEMMDHYARVAEAHPEMVQLVHDKVIYRLREGAQKGGGPMWDHLADHFKEVVPSVMADPEVVKTFPAIVETHRGLDTSEATRLREGPDDHSVGPWPIVGGVAGLALVAIALYCTSGVHPEPGTSAEVPHVPGFC